MPRSRPCRVASTPDRMSELTRHFGMNIICVILTGQGNLKRSLKMCYCMDVSSYYTLWQNEHLTLQKRNLTTTTTTLSRSYKKSNWTNKQTTTLTAFKLLTCRRNLSDRLWLANQHTQTRHKTLFTGISIREFTVISFRWALVHRRG